LTMWFQVVLKKEVWSWQFSWNELHCVSFSWVWRIEILFIRFFGSWSHPFTQLSLYFEWRFIVWFYCCARVRWVFWIVWICSIWIFVCRLYQNILFAESRHEHFDEFKDLASGL
jgi:hypothetical protein